MSKKAVVIIIDQDEDHAGLLAESVRDLGASAHLYSDPESALTYIDQNHTDMVITELNLQADLNGIEVLNQAREIDPTIAIIVTASNPSIDSCKLAIRSGASDYLEKPLDMENFNSVVSQLLADRQNSGSFGKGFAFPGVVGRSRAMQSVFHVIKRVAPTSIGVLIEGPSGTGKELIARAIHDNSERKKKQFIPINCAGLAESLLESELFGHAKGSFTGATIDRKGVFEIADQGTLFLDEIGDMPLPMQAKLLRVLEDGVIVPVGSNKSVKVDVRVISATNCNLAKLVEEKKFRQDLYFRIKGVSITLPPLCKRREDIPEMFGYFLKEACSDLGRNITRITEAAMSILQSYDWPGNIRQFRHCIRTMVVLCESDTLDVVDIPPEINRVKRLEGDVSPYPREVVGIQYPEIDGMSLEELEEMHITNTLQRTGGNRTEAAKILKIGERTLYRKIKEYGL